MVAMLLVKVTLLLLAALAVAAVLRRHSSSTRHRFWSAVFPALLAVPVLSLVLPVVPVPVPGRITIATRSAQTLDRPRMPLEAGRQPEDVDLTNPQHASAPDTDRPNPSGFVSWEEGLTVRGLLVTTWIVGAVGALAALTLSLIRVRRLAQRAAVVTDPAWLRAVGNIAGRLGLRPLPRVLRSPAVSTPMAGGVLRPSVFLPVSSATWNAEQRDLILAHEIAHLVERDPLRHVVARLTLACYWFHPLAWIAARQAAIVREEACDAAVLSLGTRPSAYAQVLLDLAESVGRKTRSIGALPIVDPTMLEKRVMAILSSDVRPTKRGALFAPTAVLALATVVVAVVQPHASTSASRSEQTAGATAVAVEPPSPPASEAPGWAPAHDIRFEGAIEIAGRQDYSHGQPACWSDVTGPRSFDGNMSMRGGVIHEQIGWRGTDRVIQKDFGDLRVCMMAEGTEDRSVSDRPSQWIDRARRVVLATERGGRVQRLEIVRESGGGQRTTWLIGGVARPADRATEQWRSQILAVLDTTWEVGMLHGRASSLRGEISSILGERSSLRGEISSLQGEVSSMRGEISSIRGHESSLRGEISSIRGHESSLRGAISSENGAISSLIGSRYGADSSERAQIAKLVADHDKEIDRIEREIRDYDVDRRVAAVEKEIAGYDADGKTAAIEARIKAFDVDRKIAQVERQIDALEVEKRVAATEREIEALDVARRTRQLEERRDGELKRLEAAIGAIR